MTTIERLELFHVAIPLALPFDPSWIPGYPERKLLEYPFEPPGWVPEAWQAILEEPIAVRGDGTVSIPLDRRLR